MIALFAGLTALAVPALEQDPPPPSPAPAASHAGQSGVTFPPGFRTRFGASRDTAARQYGGAPSEAALARGLSWLAKQQKDDGHWEFDGNAKAETGAATGMALLPFLAAGTTPRTGKYQKTVAAGIEWLRQAQRPDGGFAPAATMYSQAIAAQAFVECYGMTRDPALKGPAQAAVDFIQKAQGENGSWGYTPNTNGDTSITGWPLQVLRAARAADGLTVDQKVIAKAMAFLDTVADGPNRSRFGYTAAAGARPGTALTAIGLWSRQQFGGWTPKAPGLAEGVAGFLNPPAKPAGPPDAYRTFYAAQVLRDFGGEEWETWNWGPLVDGKQAGGMRDTLVNLQIMDAGANQWSWNPDEGYIGRCAGRVGTTAMYLLTLEVYFRYPPPEKKPDDPKP